MAPDLKAVSSLFKLTGFCQGNDESKFSWGPMEFGGGREGIKVLPGGNGSSGYISGLF